MIVLTIDFGPKVVWTLALLLVCFLGYVLWRLAGEVREYKIHKDVGKRTSWQVRSPHLTEGPAEQPQRVDPQSGVIAQRWTGERAA